MVPEPRTVPAGIYAKEYLLQQRLWATVQGKVVPTENVRAADLLFRGHQLPTLRRGTAVSRGNVLLAGDAAPVHHLASGEE